MAYTRTQAKNLLTATELSLFDAGRTADVKALTAAQLKSKVERTRKLRDKYRDLFKRQRLAARERTGSKGGRSGVANQRSKEKAVLFGELLERFQARLKQVNAAAKKAATKKTAAKKAPGKKTAAKKAAAKKTAAKKTAGKKTATKKAATKKATGKQIAASKAPTKSASKAAKKVVKKAAKKRAAKPAKKAIPGKASKAKVAKSAKSVPATATKKPGKVPAADHPADAHGAAGKGVPDGVADTRRSLADVLGAEVSPVQGGYVSSKAKSAALERRLAESRTRPIQAHMSSAGRRNQARKDRRGR